MNIIQVNTKYKAGDTIYFVEGSRIIKDTIDGISVHIIKDHSPLIFYATTLNKSVDETKAFLSQDELFASIRIPE